VYVDRFSRPRIAYRRILLLRQLNEMVPARAAEWLVLAFVIGIVFVLGPSLRAGPAGEYWMQTIIFAMYLIVRLRANLTGLLTSLMNLRFGWAAFLNVEQGLRETPIGYDVTVSAPLAFHGKLQLEDVSFIYPGSETGVFKVSTEIRSGEWIGIEGRSGAGKTTLAAIIMGLVRPQTGRILLDGMQIDIDRVGWYTNFGFVSQRFALFDDTVRANITMCSKDAIDEKRLERAVYGARLGKLLSQIPGGLDGRVGEKGSLLSGGQRQRIALARALYRRARILIFDEATSALDNTTEAEILEDLQKLRGSVTLIAIAHRSSILDLCDRVLTLEAGRLVSERAGRRPDNVTHSPLATGLDRDDARA
jgi:ABC-type multidrug transport system fused ATPase/permease subunit